MRCCWPLLLSLALAPLRAGEPPAREFALEVQEAEAVSTGWAKLCRAGPRWILEQSWPARVELELTPDSAGRLVGGANLPAGVTARLIGGGDARVQVRLRPRGPDFVGDWRIVGPAGPLRSGRATWRASEARAPSPLAAAIGAALEPVAERGTVSPGSVFNRGRPEQPALIRGRAIFGRMRDLIAGAEHEVLFLTYTWEAGCKPARQIVDGLRALAAKRKATGGPPVRAWFMVNGGWFAKRTAIKAMREDLAQLDLAPWVDVRLVRHKHKLLGALHTKSLVVDGEVAVVTGANPEAKHDGDAPWYDLGFAVHGQAAWAVREDFAQVWRKVVHEELPPLALPPAHPDDVPVFAISRQGRGNPLSRSHQDPQGRAYLAALDGAQRSIRILTPNLNYAPVKEALVRAAARGVRVQLVFSLGFNRDAENRILQGGHNAKTATWLGGRILEHDLPPGRLQVRWYSHDGRLPVDGSGPHAMHAKYLSVDDQLVIVGSTNLDTQSWLHSRELDLLVDDPATTRGWDAQVFLPVWERSLPTTRRARELPALR